MELDSNSIFCQPNRLWNWIPIPSKRFQQTKRNLRGKFKCESLFHCEHEDESQPLIQSIKAALTERLQLTSTVASHFYLNPEIDEVHAMLKEFRSRFISQIRTTPTLQVHYKKFECVEKEKQRNRFTIAQLLDQNPTRYLSLRASQASKRGLQFRVSVVVVVVVWWIADLRLLIYGFGSGGGCGGGGGSYDGGGCGGDGLVVVGVVVVVVMAVVVVVVVVAVVVVAVVVVVMVVVVGEEEGGDGAHVFTGRRRRMEVAFPKYPCARVQFTCIAHIARIEEQKDWFYIACSECRKKLQLRGTTLACSDHQPTVPKYLNLIELKMNVPDKKANMYLLISYIRDDIAEVKSLFFDNA
ncbi:hypothetical protein OSB04_012467 [Centaurea solstitialis]|uniref:Uncharacterized protein n=1 Tax=Centaurea solstitialis TaxID=347529 RepID=A0AA38TIY8_9ASTR|nr:hypothetical protein OSB04_012467 [Centaurea solstitialis]